MMVVENRALILCEYGALIKDIRILDETKSLVSAQLLTSDILTSPTINIELDTLAKEWAAKPDIVVFLAQQEDPMEGARIISESWTIMEKEYANLKSFIDNQVKQRKKLDSKRCFVATATFGSPDNDIVVQLRQFRDNVLANCLFGRVFILVYYKVGPVLAWFVYRLPFLRRVLQPLLKVVASHLNARTMS